MASEHDTLVEKLVEMGSHLEHPDAKALWNRVKGVLEASASPPGAEYPKMVYHSSDSPRKPNRRIVNSAEEEAEAKLEGFDIHPSLRTPSDAAKSDEPTAPAKADGGEAPTA